MTQRTRSYTLGGVIAGAIDVRLTEVHTACVARVVTYDATKQRASVQPLVQASYLDEAGELVVESLPTITDVPVLFPGGGPFRITFPIKADAVTGDTVLLVFSESSLDKLLDQDGNDVDPGDTRRFHLSDAVAIPGFHTFAKALATAHARNMSMGLDDGPTINITPEGHVNVGGTDPAQLEAAVLGDTLQTFLGAVASFLGSHTHVCAAAGSPSATAVGAPSAPNVKSAVVSVAK